MSRKEVVICKMLPSLRLTDVLPAQVERRCPVPDGQRSFLGATRTRLARKLTMQNFESRDSFPCRYEAIDGFDLTLKLKCAMVEVPQTC